MGTLIAYTLYKGNQPDVYPQVILPAYLSGVLWAVAQVGWFIANDALGYTTAFPLPLFTSIHLHLPTIYLHLPRFYLHVASIGSYTIALIEIRVFCLHWQLHDCLPVGPRWPGFHRIHVGRGGLQGDPGAAQLHHPRHRVCIRHRLRYLHCDEQGVSWA